MIKVFSTFTEELGKDQIFSICQLKETRWNFSINDQISWFKKNVKKKDINVLLYQDKDLIGYTLLRRRKMEEIHQSKSQTLKSIFKEGEYYYFDTHIILLKARKKGLSYPLMDENMKIIKENKLPSFLICDDDLINYYLKFKWKLLNKEDFEVKDHKFSTNGMIFNDNMSEKKIGVKKNFKPQYRFYVYKSL